MNAQPDDGTLLLKERFFRLQFCKDGRFHLPELWIINCVSHEPTIASPAPPLAYHTRSTCQWRSH
jgi:hypothetical protein